jgi:hypothetical protein
VTSRLGFIREFEGNDKFALFDLIEMEMDENNLE